MLNLKSVRYPLSITIITEMARKDSSGYDEEECFLIEISYYGMAPLNECWRWPNLEWHKAAIRWASRYWRKRLIPKSHLTACLIIFALLYEIRS